MFTEAPRLEAREPLRQPNWRDARNSALSRARQAADAGRRLREDGRSKGLDAGRRAKADAVGDPYSANPYGPAPYRPVRNVAEVPATGVSPHGLSGATATTAEPAAITEAPSLVAREPDWRDALDTALSKAREAADRGRQQGEEGRRKGQEAGAEAAGRPQEEDVDEAAYWGWATVRRRLTSVVRGWREELSSAKSLETSARDYASSLAASGVAAAAGSGKTTPAPSATSASASLPTEVRANSAEVPPLTLAGPVAAGIGIIAGVFVVL
jgi:hypothetical protein